MTNPVQQALITARQNQILDAAAAVFAEKGFYQTKTKDVARQAGIAEGTIYNYFENKTALLFGLFERMKARVIAQNMPPSFDDVDLETMISLLLYQPLVVLKQDDFALFRIVFAEIMVNTEIRTRYYQQILEPTLALAEEQLMKRGIPPLTVKVVVRALSGIVMGLIIESLMGDEVLSEQWDQLPTYISNIIVKGIENNS